MNELPSSQAGNDDYPVRFNVEYGDGTRNRLTTLLRLFMNIPILILSLCFYVVFTGGWQDNDLLETPWFLPSITFGLFLIILFRRKYPRWIFDFILELERFFARVGAYTSLLVDRYPSTDDHQDVLLEIDYPDAENELNRFLPIVKWLLAIPHYICIAVLGVAAFIAIIVAWFAILITGVYPRPLFDFVVGVGRWWQRVNAYAFILVTDRYPPFSLK